MFCLLGFCPRRGGRELCGQMGVEVPRSGSRSWERSFSTSTKVRFKPLLWTLWNTLFAERMTSSLTLGVARTIWEKRSRYISWMYSRVIGNMFWIRKALWRLSTRPNRIVSQNPWNASNMNSSTIWITTITDAIRLSERACRLQFTDNKPFRLLEQFLFVNIV